MQRNMAQEHNSGVRRRSLESPMKESQARTKVVLRHLPPSISQAVLLEYLESKYAGCYTWFSFRPGKASLKRQIFSRAYINFKRPEDVYDFYEDFDGHIFLNERGTQYKVAAEYAPCQRVPKPRSKKDIREGTIAKDPDYLEFLEMLGRPVEYLPSAEVQLERREAEKAAALVAGTGKESIVVTPLMEFVRQRRAAKSAPQRTVSSKMAARSGGVTVITSNLTSHRRGLERSRSGPLMYVPENSMSMQKDFKEPAVWDHTAGQRREEQQQRKEREVPMERRKKEMTEGKERRLVHESATQVVTKGSPLNLHLETNKDSPSIAISSKDSMETMIVGESITKDLEAADAESLSSPGIAKSALNTLSSTEGTTGDTAKDLNKREVAKRKQLMEARPTSPGGSSLYNQRHRPPVSPKVATPSTHLQLATSSHHAASDEVCTTAATSKLAQRREVSGRSFSRGALLSREQQSPSQQHAASSHVTLLLDSQGQSQQGSTQSDKGGKRPPRPQNVRLGGKEQISSPFDSEVGGITSNANGPPSIGPQEKVSSTLVTEPFSGSDRQDSRRVRNKDRPDRPVWTPRRRADTVPSLDPVSSVPPGASVTQILSPDSVDLSSGGESNSKPEKVERAPNKLTAKSASAPALNFLENKIREVHSGAGQSLDGGRSQSGSGSLVSYGPVSGKTRYVEASTIRSARARAVPGNVSSIQEHVLVHQGDHRSESSIPGTAVDSKVAQVGVYHTRENGENHASSLSEKEKRKQDTTLPWNELSGGSHRSGDRRRERNAHGSRDSDGNSPELTKTVKRAGSLVMGSNEKQVWVAVQKSGSGT